MDTGLSDHSSLEGIYSDDQQARTRFILRPLQYDLLDSNSSRMPHAALEIGRTEIDLASGTSKLHELELFNVTNLLARRIPLPSLPDMAWHASSGFASSRLDCSHCLDGHATFLAGKSFRLGHRSLPFIMTGGQLRSERHQEGPAAPMLQLGLLYDWEPGQRSLLQITHADGLKGEESRRTQWLLEHRMAVGQQLDLRARWEGDDNAQELGLGVSWYF
ncbi:DUF7840 domain-containing protein [Halomonas sp. B23F22_10]|uniref:DUF7840 domain-containing protein n=1 Tax=Halomonas sp. B23F22_10 TaxID=3459515 RepID=UPI00373DFFD0